MAVQQLLVHLSVNQLLRPMPSIGPLETRSELDQMFWT
jgi:hypothetical protein